MPLDPSEEVGFGFLPSLQQQWRVLRISHPLNAQVLARDVDDSEGAIQPLRRGIDQYKASRA